MRSDSHQRRQGPGRQHGSETAAQRSRTQRRDTNTWYAAKSARSLLGSGLVQGHGGADEGLQRLLVYLFALMEVDGTPCVPVKAGVEEAGRIFQSRSFGEGHLHVVLISLACADHSVVRPQRNSPPLPLLDDFGIGFLH